MEFEYEVQSLQGVPELDLRTANPDPDDRRCVGAIGSLAISSWARCGGGELGFLAPREVLVVAGRGKISGLDEEVGLVASHLVNVGITPGSESDDWLKREIGRFCERLRLLNVVSLRSVTHFHVEEFVFEAVKSRGGWSEPSESMISNRRTSVRVLFRTARLLALADHDPTIDVVVPPRCANTARPLTDNEEFEGRLASRRTLTETRLPTAWALGQASATSSEISQARVRDVDLDRSRVWLHDNPRRVDRWGELTDWGVERIARRLEELRRVPDASLVYGGSKGGKSGHAASSGAIRQVLVLAGLSREPGITAASLARWRGQKVFDETGRIEEAAQALGLRSLDRAAEAIGWSWR